MTFNIKQLMLCMAFIAVGLTALLFAGTPFVAQLIDLLTLATLVIMAYGAWIYQGERRAFRIGFVFWGVLYYWFFKKEFDIGASELLYRVSSAFRKVGYLRVSDSNTDGLFGTPQLTQQRGSAVDWDQSYYSIGNALFLLLFALIGGFVTVYFYRKRQRMLAQNTTQTNR